MSYFLEIPHSVRGIDCAFPVSTSPEDSPILLLSAMDQRQVERGPSQDKLKEVLRVGDASTKFTTLVTTHPD